MKAFRERNPVVAGVVGLTLILLLMLAAFRAQDLPLIGGGSTYTAAFTEAAGLKPNDEVRVAGVRVGQVEKVELAGDHVKVTFRVQKGVKLGQETRAETKIKTLLGAKFLMLEPDGPGELKNEIPLERTIAPYDVIEAFSDLATTTERIDTAQLAKALDTLSTTFQNTPEEVQASLTGLSRLSRNVAARDAELKKLLQHSKVVTKVLADRNQQLITLLRDGTKLFQSIQARRALVHQLLVTAQSISAQITALVRENRKDLAPTLQRVNNVLGVLLQNQKALDDSIRLLAPFVRVFANTLGTGPWFDTFIQNLVPVPQLPKVQLPNGGGGR